MNLVAVEAAILAPADRTAVRTRTVGDDLPGASGSDRKLTRDVAIQIN
jgi:hypothetical protein